MLKTRIVCRILTYDFALNKVLLVRNENATWWYAPGGGWNHDNETLHECGQREVLEETGIEVSILNNLYTQELVIKKDNELWLEHFLLAEPKSEKKLPENHFDFGGIVEEARWFSKQDLQDLTIYPEILKSTFWDTIHLVKKIQNQNLGRFIS